MYDNPLNNLLNADELRHYSDSARRGLDILIYSIYNAVFNKQTCANLSVISPISKILFHHNYLQDILFDLGYSTTVEHNNKYSTIYVDWSNKLIESKEINNVNSN